MAGAETTTRRGRRPRAPSLWMLAAGLLAVAGLAFVAASRVGDDVDRLEGAETLPFQLEERGLVSALCDYVEVVREQAGIDCALSAKLPERLPEDQEIVLYRVAQEALTNVELAGGTWTVWSREGSGTVLTATLPKTRVAA